LEININSYDLFLSRIVAARRSTGPVADNSDGKFVVYLLTGVGFFSFWAISFRKSSVRSTMFASYLIRILVFIKNKSASDRVTEIQKVC